MKQIAFIKDIVSDKKIYIYILIMLLLGIFLMLIKSPENNADVNTIPTNASNVTHNDNINYETSEYKLINILKKVEGVGDVDLIINYISTPEKVPLIEISSQDKEKIINKTDGSKTEPYIVTELNAEIEGVVVVAEGGDDVEISNILKNTVSSYLGIPIHKVSVLKMK